MNKPNDKTIVMESDDHYKAEIARLKQTNAELMGVLKSCIEWKFFRKACPQDIWDKAHQAIKHAQPVSQAKGGKANDDDAAKKAYMQRSMRETRRK